MNEKGLRRKHFCVPESVGIATGFLNNALHQLGIATLTDTPNPMTFLNQILERPGNEMPYMLLVGGHPAQTAMVPRAATVKNNVWQISTFIRRVRLVATPDTGSRCAGERRDQLY